MEHSSIEIKLSRSDKTYRSNEKVEGFVIIYAYKGWSHSGVTLVAEGFAHTTHSPKGLSVDCKSLQLLKLELDIFPTGKFNDGLIEIPFSFPLVSVPGQILLETYRGIYISVSYMIYATCDRGVMKKSLKAETELLVEVTSITAQTNFSPQEFSISPASLENVRSDLLATIPEFKITGKMHKTKCLINQPFTGEFNVEISLAPIRSVELQLVRVETVLTDGKETKDASEIQNIQIGDGNICRFKM